MLSKERHQTATGPEDYASTTAPGSGSVRSLFANRLGSIAVAVSVATGAVAAEAEYDSFGARTIVAGTEAEMPRYGFTGREHDAESGLVFYRARHYDPAIGQFIQRDPIGFAAGDLNLYAYVWNDPYNWTDPSGLISNAENLALTATVTAGGVGGLLGALYHLANLIADVLATTPSNDEPDDPPDNPPIPADPPPPCDPTDPNCEDECSEDDYYGEDDYLDAWDHFNDELLDVRDGFDWQRVIQEGTKFFDTETGNFVYTLGSDVVVVDENYNPRSAYEGNSNATTSRKEQSGRWQRCND